MVATVVVKELNGGSEGSPVYTTITQGRYGTKDTYDRAAQLPIPIPTSGFNYSYWKHHCLDLSGTFTEITNIRWYCDGAIGWDLGTSGKLQVGLKSSGDNGCPEASYDPASGTEGTTGDDMDDVTNGHGYYKQGTGNYSAPGNAESYNSVGNALTVDTTTYNAAGQTKSVVTQVVVDTAANGALQGDKADETFTFLYNEV